MRTILIFGTLLTLNHGALTALSSGSLRRLPCHCEAIQLRKPRMIIRSSPRGVPMEQTVALLDGYIVDAGLSPPHQALLIELPVLVTVRAVPGTRMVMPPSILVRRID